MKRHVLQRYLGRPPSPKPAMAATAQALIATNGEHRGYPGAKNAPGVFHTIINNIPPHDTFVECFAGSAAITRRKRPASSTIVIESDATAYRGLVETFRQTAGTLIEQLAIADVGQHEAQLGDVRLVFGCAVEWLAKNRGNLSQRTVIYCDPPYLNSVRATPGRRYYAKEFGKGYQHEDLLEVLTCQLTVLKIPVLLSGRPSPLYDHWLKGWRRVDYQTATHAGPVMECLWCNFPEPTALHDYRFLGRDFRERERIKRKLARWRARLQKMPILERRVVSAALAINDGAGLPQKTSQLTDKKVV